MSSGEQIEPTATDSQLDKKCRRRVSLSFALATVAFILITIFYYSCLPHASYMMVVPEVTFALAFMPPLFMWQTLAEKRLSLKIAGVSSLIMWVLGVVASFVIKPNSVLIYVPDALLLSGFLPLLYSWRFSWPWIIFGGFNLAIGFLLLFVTTINDSYFPSALWPGKHHLADYHPGLTWMLMGLACCLFGFGRLLKNLFLMIKKRRASAQTTAPLVSE